MMRPSPESFTLARESLRPGSGDGQSPVIRFLTWVGTAALVLGLHVGIYLAVMRTDNAPITPPAPPAAVMINMAPIAISQKSETDNATDAPIAADSQPSETSKASEAEVAPPPPEPEPIVQAPPPPPSVTSEAVLPPPPPKEVKPVKEKKEVEKPKPTPVKAKPVEKKSEKKPDKKQEKRQASRQGGAPKSDRNDAATAAAAAGSAASDVSQASWKNEVRGRIVRAKRFPSEARGQTGVAVVSVTFNVGGSASGVRLVRSSGNAALDAEAVAVMHRAAPYPPPPGGQATVLTVPINFTPR